MKNRPEETPVTIRRLTAFLLCVPLIPAADLPVRSVVVYKHGVAYFERQGTLKPGESAHLDFKADQMNDVLKSLTITDQGGKITELRYDADIPLDQKLSEFPFRIKAGEPLTSLIDQLKGAHLEMMLGAQNVAGNIVTARMIPADKERQEREQVTLLMDTGELRNVDLSAASSIRFTDSKLQAQFKDYLTALAGEQSEEKRSIYIDSSEAASRTMRASYILPMPAWKSSYRLLFDTAASPTLEGWAIVDNTTGEDWTNVRLSLVSGKPISFISQLYPPKYINRSGADLPEDRAITPTVYGGAVAAAKVPSPAPPPVAGVVGGVGGGVFRTDPAFGLRTGTPADAQPQQSNIAATADSAELADLFEYTIGSPVTVHREQSTMLPFLQQKIGARKLSVYSDTGSANPLSAAELINDTGKTLDGGPLTIYEGGAYVGEALVETIKNGDKRLISYGVDLGTRVSTNLKSRSDAVRELHARNGIITTKSALVHSTTYTIHNIDPRAKTLIIEYPVREGYTLVDTAKPFETARNAYRFEIKLPASGSMEFSVTEEHVYDTQSAVTSLNPDTLSAWIQNGNVSDAAKVQLRQIAGLKTQLVNADNEKTQLNGQIDGLTRDEERNRQNITSLSAVSSQQQVVQDYARRLAEQETQISALRDRLGALDRQRDGLERQVNDLIGKLNF